MGGERNYDDRCPWVRDASFALDALTLRGYREQVHASLARLLQAVGPAQPHLVPLYTLGGQIPRGVSELELDGYRGSKPVRQGNQASGQLQLGCYGDLLETVELYAREGNVLDQGAGARIGETVNLLCEIWRNDDSGLWELPDLRPYTISKMSSWVAFDRAIRLAQTGQIPGGDAERWRREAE